MNVMIRRPSAAVGNLTSLVDDVITPNGMYGEMVYQDQPGEFSPVSESAYCGAGVVHTLLLHSRPDANIVDIFPGVPVEWSDVNFHLLRAQGGWLLSAVKQDGVVTFVRLENGGKEGAVLNVSVAHDDIWQDKTRPPSAVPSIVPVVWAGSGCWAVGPLAPGQHVILYVGERPDKFVISPVPANTTEFNWFGYRRPMQPMH